VFSMVQKLRRFARDNDGSVMAETVIVLPVLLWSYLALFVYWDAFRSTNEVQKATYTISDIISREMVTKPQSYFDGLRDVAEFLVDADQDVKMRVTSITYDEDDARFEVLWSYSPDNTMPALTTATLQNYASRIPDMNDADFATIVETEVDYEPAFNVGLTDQTMQQFIVTRPRFVAPNCLSGATCTPV
jgi:Flp pilus assembly protein TadG